jgi:2-oxoglutarate dehydrogenase E1 component
MTQGADLSLNGWNAQYIETLYRQWREQPDSVDQRWHPFFQGFDLGQRSVTGDEPGSSEHVDAAISAGFARQAAVDSLIYHYRDIGHHGATLDPLGSPRPRPAALELEAFGLSEADLDHRFDPGHLPLEHPCTLRDIISMLRDTYCRNIGVEYLHIEDRDQRRWLQSRMEPVRNRPKFTVDQKRRVLSSLIDAVAFEQFLDTRYRGAKRFGIDGGESLIPLLDLIVEHGPGAGVDEFTIGMAHRGRLNVLVNILRKTYDQIFTEFEEAWVEDFIEGGGDVKYHRGYSSDHVTESGDTVRLTLSPNPSHLEFGHAVVLGRARAKQRMRKDTERQRCVPILIHGDASFPGQGVVAEMFNMARLDGYTVGGAIHVVVNNQIGFTTDPRDAHSGHYCTDIAKMVGAPIFHVNGDDPEACVWAANLALEYRQQFKNDVVIDMWCYRKYGHNEGDEPTFTQPVLYKKIRQQTPVIQKYAADLMEQGILDDQRFEELKNERKQRLDEAQTRSQEHPVASTVEAFKSTWSGYAEHYNDNPVETGVDRDLLAKVGEALGNTPDEFNVHRKLKKRLAQHGSAIRDEQTLDWALGELLAYGTLLAEGHDVRLTGQDTKRGTFSHRHAVLFDAEDGRPYIPLNNIDPQQGKLCIYNSPLTEAACVGFEYGYSLGDPRMLIVWEAQFGDFANGAQVYFDQFISSAEIKWQRFSGLTLFLPHAYEGQGPEHSSARLERFLALCARDNMQVVYPTTPAQMFHLLRRQLKRPFRKPLVVMTPKSLLRHAQAVSPVEALISDRFHHVLDDDTITDPHAVGRVVLCSGKVYYDLMQHREAAQRRDVAIIRLEQLYPFRAKSLAPVLDRYATTDIVWVQEEPANMGAYKHVSEMMKQHFEIDLPYVGRAASPSPAVASMKMHLQQQDRIMINAIGLPEICEVSFDEPSKGASPPVASETNGSPDATAVSTSHSKSKPTSATR